MVIAFLNIIKEAWKSFSGLKKILLIISFSLFLGFLTYLLIYSQSIEYLSSHSTMCAKCHVMESQYSTWNHSSHRQYAKCVDCHLPNNNFLSYYFAKGRDGIKDLSLFMLRKEKNLAQATHHTKDIIQQNCIRCHSNTITLMKDHIDHIGENTKRFCWECHRYIPHGRVKGLPSIVQSNAQLEPKPVPDWLEKKLNNKGRKNEK